MNERNPNKKEQISNLLKQALQDKDKLGLGDSSLFFIEGEINEYLECYSDEAFKKILKIFEKGNDTAKKYYKDLSISNEKSIPVGENVIGEDTVPLTKSNANETLKQTSVSDIKNVNIQRQQVVELDVSLIKTDPEVSAIFTIDTDTLKALENSIREKGFLISNPIILRDKNGEYLVEDGHTRLKAAKSCGIKKVFVIIKPFTTQDDFIEDAIKAQTFRRDNKPSVLFNAIEKMSEIEGKKAKQRQGHKRTSLSEDSNAGTASNIIAKKLGIGEATVYKIKYLQKNAPKELIDSILKLDISISKAYNNLVGNKNEASPPANQKVNNAVAAEQYSKPNSEDKSERCEENISDENIAASIRVTSSEDKISPHVKSKQKNIPGWGLPIKVIMLIKMLIKDLKTHHNYDTIKTKYLQNVELSPFFNENK